MSKVTMKKFDVDWTLIKNECRQTINLKDSSKTPNDEWKKKLLICRHSPLRTGTMIVHIDDLEFFAHVHLVRHQFITPFVGTSRDDRNNDGIPRSEKSQTDPISMDLMMNVESLMNISEKRLCMCASKETRGVWNKVVEEVGKYDENLAWACVPSCVAKGGCVEPFSDCPYFEKFASTLTKEELIDMRTRLDKYNEYREKVKVKK